MYSTVIGRTALRSRVATRQLIRSDLYHFENTKGQNIPFKTTSRPALATGMTIALGAAFLAPFGACAWQFHKAG